MFFEWIRTMLFGSKKAASCSRGAPGAVGARRSDATTAPLLAAQGMERPAPLPMSQASSGQRAARAGVPQQRVVAGQPGFADEDDGDDADIGQTLGTVVRTVSAWQAGQSGGEQRLEAPGSGACRIDAVETRDDRDDPADPGDTSGPTDDN